MGVTYALTRSNISTFNDNTRNVFETLNFRSGLAQNNALERHCFVSHHAVVYIFFRRSRRQVLTMGVTSTWRFQVAGAGGNVKYFSPVAAFRQFYPMKGFRINREGHNVLGMRACSSPMPRASAAR